MQVRSHRNSVISGWSVKHQIKYNVGHVSINSLLKTELEIVCDQKVSLAIEYQLLPLQNTVTVAIRELVQPGNIL